MVPHTIARMNLEDTRLNKISIHKTTSTVTFHLHWIVGVIKLIETESRKVVTRDWGERKWRIV